MGWVGEKVLVIGAGGFIGSHLVERLVEQGATVRAFVRYNSRSDLGFIDSLSDEIVKSIEVVCGDLKDPSAIRRAVEGQTTVFHLAALIAIPYSYVHPMDIVQTNVVGTANVLDACRASGVECLVHTSTSEVYGTAQTQMITEEHPLSAQSPYAASKVAADQLALSYQKSFGLPVSILRPFNTYGPRQSARAVIPTIIIQTLAADQVCLGELSSIRDFCYVDDTVEAFLAIAKTTAAIGSVVQVGSGREISISEVAKTIAGIVGREVPIVSEQRRIRPPASEVVRLLCDASKAKHLMGWVPRIELEEGLARTIEWVRQNLGRYKIAQYNI